MSNSTNKFRINFGPPLDAKLFGACANQPATSPTAARSLFVAKNGQKPLLRRPRASIRTALASSITELAELARALKHDPDLIFEFVYNEIDYIPKFGFAKGGYGALVDRSGTAFDQSDLMVQLLRESGFQADYVLGDIRLTATQWANLLGLNSTDLQIASTMLANGGVPNSPDAVNNELVISHCWVRVAINGSDFVFDPAIKTYSYKTGIDLATVLAYSRNGFLTNAEVGALVTADYVQNINQTNIHAELTSYSHNLVDWIKNNNAAASLNEIVGGREIVRAIGTQRNTSLAYEDGSIQVVSTIPSMYHGTVRIALQNDAGTTTYFDLILRSSEVHGQRLSLWWSQTSPSVGKLYLNGSVLATTPNLALHVRLKMIVEITHPYPTTFADEQFSYLAFAENYEAIGISFGPTGREVGDRRRASLNEYMQANSVARGENALGNSLSAIFWDSVGQFTKLSGIVDQISECQTTLHHIVGKVTHVYDSVGYQQSITAHSAKWSTTGKTPAADAVASNYSHSLAFKLTEEAVFAQVTGIRAAAGPTVFQEANAQGSRTYRATLTNWASVVRPALASAGWTVDDLNGIEALITGSPAWELNIPEDASVTIGSSVWNIYGGANPTGSAILTRLGGAGKGGGGTEHQEPGGVNSVASTNQLGPNGLGQPAYPAYQSAEPVDMLTGSYLHTGTDISVGNQSEPYQLSFVRTYNSANRFVKQGLGFGWNHNHQISAKTGSDGYIGLGEEQVIAACGAIAVLFAAHDIIRDDKTLPVVRFLALCIMHQWLASQISSNVVIVQFGSEDQLFSKLPNGTYLPPLRVNGATALTKQGNNYLYKTADKVAYSFNTDGTISTVTYPCGLVISYTYSSGRLTQVSNGFRTLTFNYNNTTGNLTSVNDGNGRTVALTVDASDDLSSVKDLLNNVTTFQYDSPGLLTKIFRPANPSTPVVTNIYDSKGMVEIQLDAYGNQWSYYFAAKSRAEEVDPVGSSKISYYNRHGSSIKDVNALGFVRTTSFDGLQRPTVITAPEGNTTSFVYDINSNVIQTTVTAKPGSGLAPITSSCTYDPVWNKVVSVTDPRNNVTTYTYDSQTGQLTQVQFPTVAAGVATITYTYNSIGQLLTVTDASGRMTSFTYDPNTRNLLSTVEAVGTLNLTTSFGYDAVGNLTSSTDANGRQETMVYDAERRLVQRTDPAPYFYVATFTYDANGNEIEAKRQNDAGSISIATTYTVDDLVLTETEPSAGNDPSGNTTTYEYDSLRRVSFVTNGLGLKNRLYYDALGRISEMLDTSGNSTEAATYSPNGRLLSVTDCRSHTTSYTYDGFDRLIRTTYPDLTYADMAYDAADNMTQVITRNGAIISYSYDAMNRMVSKSPQGQPTVGFAYDLDGRLISAETTAVSGDFASGKYERFYDAAGRYFQERYPDGKTVTMALDNVGNLIDLTYPDGSTIVHAYDELNRLVSIAGCGGTSTFAYDELSRRKSVLGGNGAATIYGYDKANNLDSMVLRTSEPLSLSYSYDRLSQRIASRTNKPSTLWQPQVANTMVYAAANTVDQYPSVDSVPYIYDEDGSLADDGTFVYSYDAESRLVGVTSPGLNVSFKYDPFGRQVLRVSNGVPTRFVYAGLQRIADYDGSDAKLRNYVYGVGMDECLWVQDGAGLTTYLHYDASGSPIQSSDNSGILSGQASYSPWGTPSSNIPFDIGFCGQRYDAQIGLYYSKLRYYSPLLGRFIQTDPSEHDGGSLNLYLYADSDPVNLSDPFGLSSVGGYQSFQPASGSLFTLSVAQNVAINEVPINAIAPSPILLASNPHPKSTYGTKYVVRHLSNGATQVIVNPSALADPRATGTIHIGIQRQPLKGEVRVNVGMSTQRRPSGELNPNPRSRAHTKGVSKKVPLGANKLHKEVILVTTKSPVVEVEESLMERVRQKMTNKKSKIKGLINTKPAPSNIHIHPRLPRGTFLLSPGLDMLGPLIEYQWWYMYEGGHVVEA